VSYRERLDNTLIYHFWLVSSLRKVAQA
jgi:hypothetical protein